MTVKRYRLPISDDEEGVIDDPDGEYLRYTDHLAIKMELAQVIMGLIERLDQTTTFLKDQIYKYEHKDQDESKQEA
jgi:hypothetical protein